MCNIFLLWRYEHTCVYMHVCIYATVCTLCFRHTFFTTVCVRLYVYVCMCVCLVNQGNIICITACAAMFVCHFNRRLLIEIRLQ